MATAERVRVPGRRSLLTEKEAAALLRLSYRSLQGLRVRGGGPRFVKLGRSVRYRLSDLDKFIQKSLRMSTSDPGDDG